MEPLPERMPEAFITPSPQAHYLTAIQIARGVEPTQVLARLVMRLLKLAEDSGTRITLHLEPAGDACETGHWVCIHCEHGMVWADMTPCPERHNGVVPEGIDALLELAGWILQTTGPEDDSGFYYADLTNAEDLLHVSLPARRLLAVAAEENLMEWAEQVSAAIQLVIEPVGTRWFFIAEAFPSDDPRNARTHYDYLASDHRWPVDIGGLLEPLDWERAIWPSGTESAGLCCLAGLHEFHEPPCQPEPLVTEALD